MSTDSLIEALRRAQMKLRAYTGVCKDDKELPKVIEIVSDALNALTCECPIHARERQCEIPVVDAETIVDRILSKKLFYCSNATGDPVKQMIDEIRPYLRTIEPVPKAERVHGILQGYTMDNMPLSEHPIESPSCPRCGEFFTKIVLKNLFDTHTKVETSFYCFICNRTFEEEKREQKK